MSARKKPDHGAKDRFCIAEWETQVLRMTAFPAKDTNFNYPATEPSWWEQLVGEPPALKAAEPRIQAHREEGPIGSGILKMTLFPARIDWLLEASDPEPQDEIPGPPSVGDFIGALGIFKPLMTKWIVSLSLQPISRLAFGATLLHRVPSQQKGYELLSSCLPDVNLDSQSSSEFMYQINRPRCSRSVADSLDINRLSRWSVMGFATLGVMVNKDQSRSSISEPIFACSLVLDINTSEDRSEEIDKKTLSAIFQELVDLGKEIASHGDIP